MTRRKNARTVQQPYTEFLRSLDLIWISLVNTQFSGDRQQYFEHKDHQLAVSWKSEAIEFGEDFFEVRADIAVKLSAPKSTRGFFDLTATYMLHIHAPSPVDREYVARFAESELRLVIWPYIREYVSSVSGRMHVPPVLLPLVGGEQV